MPKETFFNIAEDKRQRIIDSALEEFAMYDYNTASLSRIVEKTGIAKGSMYQYFENKKDLYFYLIDLAANTKLAYINQNLDQDIKDFFEVYKNMIFVGAKFDLDNPLFSRIMYNAGREGYNEEIGSMVTELLNRSKEYLKQFVLNAQDQGQIRTDIDTGLIAFVISQLSVYVQEYISDKFNFLYADIIKEGRGKLPITDEELEGVLDELIMFFKTGLQA